MTADLDQEKVLEIARLARIAITPTEADELMIDLKSILAFAGTLNEVDVSGVEPMTSVVHMKLPMRRDVVSEGGDTDAVLRNAPAVADGYFLVPKVLE